MPFPPFPTLPAPSTWVNGPVLTSQLRNDAQNAILFLSNRPLYLGQDTGAGAAGSGVDASLGMNVDQVDSWNGHNQQIDFTKYYCQAAGWYLCQGTCPWAYSGSTQYVFTAGFTALSGGVATGVVRGQLQLQGSTHFPEPQVADLILQSVTGAPGGGGDWISLTGMQATGSSIATVASGNLFPYVVIRWVCATSGTQPLIVPANASWPVPPAYVTPAFLNTNIRDTISFLTYPPICRAHYTPGSTTMPSQTFPAGTVINLGTVDVDNYGGYTTGSSGGYTAPVGGVYFIYGQINFAATASTTIAYSAGLSVNGGTVQWGDSVFKTTADVSGCGAIVRKRLRLNAGDFVQFYGQQSSGGSLGYNGTTANQTRFIAVWECS